MQVCTSLQTDNHASTPPLCFLQAGCPSCHPTNNVKALKATRQQIVHRGKGRCLLSTSAFWCRCRAGEASGGGGADAGDGRAGYGRDDDDDRGGAAERPVRAVGERPAPAEHRADPGACRPRPGRAAAGRRPRRRPARLRGGLDERGGQSVGARRTHRADTVWSFTSRRSRRRRLGP